MKLSKEEFCKYAELTEDQFYGRDIIDRDLNLGSLEYLPEGCSLKVIDHLYLYSLNELPEGCTLIADYINLSSLKVLPENYLIETGRATCKIVIPTFKYSSEFFFGRYALTRSFKEFSHIKENPLKYLRSTNPLEVALAEYFLKNP